MLEEKGPQADAFFATKISVGWLRDIENGDFSKVCALYFKFVNFL